MIQNVNVVIKRSSYTGESRGFCFVNYTNGEEARRAKEALNHTDILGREIRICFKKDFKNLDPEANVYIKNIAEELKGKLIEQEFSVYGPIFSSVVRSDENGKPLGYGYVQFKEKESAEKAITGLNGKILGGKAIIVQKFNPKRSRPVMNWKTNLYVKNFPKSWTEEQVTNFIKDKFSQFGQTTSTCIKLSDKVGRFFAFISYEKDEDAAKALKALNEHELEGEQLYVGLAQKKSSRKRQLTEEFAKQTNETNLFIKSLKEEVTQEELREVFSEYGEVLSIALKVSTKIPKSIESQGVKLQFGFINFKDEKDAKKAFVEAKKNKNIKKFISQYHDDNKDFLYFAQPRTVRDQYLRMVRKNLQSTNILQTQMNMFKMMLQMYQNPGAVNKGKQGGNPRKTGPRNAAQPSIPPMQMPMGFPPMMLGQQGMNPSFMEHFMLGSHPQMAALMAGNQSAGFPQMPFPGAIQTPVAAQQTPQPEAPKVKSGYSRLIQEISIGSSTTRKSSKNWIQMKKESCLEI